MKYIIQNYNKFLFPSCIEYKFYLLDLVVWILEVCSVCSKETSKLIMDLLCSLSFIPPKRSPPESVSHAKPLTTLPPHFW